MIQILLVYTCFGCGKPGHIKIDCPNNQNKEKPTSKKRVKEAEEKEHISLGRKMKSPQLEVKKKICASWCMMKDQSLIR